MFGTIHLVLLLVFSSLILDINAHNKQREYKNKSRECKRQCLEQKNSQDNPHCLHQCIDTDCYHTIFHSNPLELGEIDRFREKKFLQCVMTPLIHRKQKDL